MRGWENAERFCLCSGYWSSLVSSMDEAILALQPKPYHMKGDAASAEQYGSGSECQ